MRRKRIFELSRRCMLPGFSLALCCTLACAASPAQPPISPQRLVSDGRYAMGTVLELTIATSDELAGREWIDQAFSRVAQLEQLFARREPASELARLNAAAGKGMRPADARLVELLSLGIEYRSATQGCFDIRVAPLLELWRDAAERQRVPSHDELARVRERVAAAEVQLDGAGRVGLTAGGAIDLGGIAKGYALDRLAAELRTRGASDALLSFGQSSVIGLGAPPGAGGWRLLLRTPGADYAGFVTLRNRALSVSSSLGQWSLIEGERYGHVIDPRSGVPVKQGLQATVIAPTAAFAEALSTALVVLGEVEGVSLIESIAGTEAMFVSESGAVATTRGWQAASEFEPIDNATAAGSTGRSEAGAGR